MDLHAPHGGQRQRGPVEEQHHGLTLIAAFPEPLQRTDQSALSAAAIPPPPIGPRPDDVHPVYEERQA
jgi:hypothetical protein